MSWGKLDQKFATDPAVANLSPEAKALFVYAWTHSPDAMLTGLSRLTLKQMGVWLQNGTPIGDDRLHHALDELAAKPLVVYDYDHAVIWVVSRVRYVSHSSEGWKVAAERAIARIPPASPLRSAWLQTYGGALGSRARALA